MSESRLPGVEVFAAGVHKGTRYTPRDLDDVVKNFERFSSGRKPVLAVPAVLGHDEDQVTLRGSGLPAAGWAERVYRRGDRLFADFVGVPAKVMRLLKGKVYRKVSAELYEEPPSGCRGGRGRTLRRVAFLGGDLPAVKGLEDIPVPESMSEGRWRVGRDEMLSQLSQLGADVEVLGEASDAVLAEVLRLLDGGGAAEPAGAGAGNGNGMQVFSESGLDEVTKVRRYAASIAPQLERMGGKPGDLVRAYQHARRLSPGLSAKAFYDPNGVFSGGR